MPVSEVPGRRFENDASDSEDSEQVEWRPTVEFKYRSSPLTFENVESHRCFLGSLRSLLRKHGPVFQICWDLSRDPVKTCPRWPSGGLVMPCSLMEELDCFIRHCAILCQHLPEFCVQVFSNKPDKCKATFVSIELQLCQTGTQLLNPLVLSPKPLRLPMEISNILCNS